MSLLSFVQLIAGRSLPRVAGVTEAGLYLAGLLVSDRLHRTRTLGVRDLRKQASERAYQLGYLDEKDREEFVDAYLATVREARESKR